MAQLWNHCSSNTTVFPILSWVQGRIFMFFSVSNPAAIFRSGLQHKDCAAYTGCHQWFGWQSRVSHIYSHHKRRLKPSWTCRSILRGERLLAEVKLDCSPVGLMVLKQWSFRFSVYLYFVQLLPIKIKFFYLCLIIQCIYFRPVDVIRDVMGPDRCITILLYWLREYWAS